MTKTTNTETPDTTPDTPAQPTGNDVATPLQALVRVLKHRAEFLGFIFAAGYTLHIPADEARRLQDLGIVEIIG